MGLIERLRDQADEWFEMCDDIHEPLTEAADALEKLRGYAEHFPLCKGRTDGDCTCGLSVLLKEIGG